MADLGPNPAPKYARATVVLQLGISMTWMRDGGEADLIRKIEEVMGVYNGTGVGPGGAVMHGLLVTADAPGQVKRYPLVPDHTEVSGADVCEDVCHPGEGCCGGRSTPEVSPTTGGSGDMHEPPPYPARSLEFIDSPSEDRQA